MSVLSAVIDFNDEKFGICKVAEHLSLELESSMISRIMVIDRERIANVARKSTTRSKRKRKKLRAIEKRNEEQGSRGKRFLCYRRF